MSKRQYGRELWDRMCQFVETPDDLDEYECGPWTIDKLNFLCNYLAITSHAMRDHPGFRSLNYIDLFCGSGVCAVRRDGDRITRYPGSALLAAGCEKPFHNLFLVDADSSRLDAVTNRISRLHVSSSVHTWNKDANTVVAELAKAIPSDSLNIAFVDPYSIDIHFETIKRLAATRPLDLLILFADRMDIGRNVEKYYLSGDKLDLFLGTESDWRTDWHALQNRDGGRVRQLFADIYLRQLAKLGYEHSRTRVIESDMGPLYRLVYASKHPLGLKFWDIAVSDNLGGQKNLWSV